MSDPQSPRRSGSRWVVVTVVLLALFALWPLSVGPIVWLFRHGMLSESMMQVVEVVYAPWEWLYQNNETAEAFFDWYTDLWDGAP